MRDPEGPEFEAMVDAVVKRLQSGLGRDIPIPIPKGEPDLERPQLPWDPLDEGPVPRLRRRKLQIAGMELTQSIQHHGAAGQSFAPDNSVPLVALKTLVARVYPYVRPGLAWPDALTGQRVTGELVLSIGHHVVYRTGPTRADGMRVGPVSELSRTLWDQELVSALPGPGGIAAGLSRLNCSLNFLVPAYYCRRGQMHVAVRVWRVGASALPGAEDSAAVDQYVEFLDVPAPRIALVRVDWDDGRGTVTSPSDVEMLKTIRLAERMFPFPYFDATILGFALQSSAAFALWVSGGGCNQAWRNLLNVDLQNVCVWTRLFQFSDIVFGSVPKAAIPGRRALLAQSGSTGINSGCGQPTGVGGCFVEYDRTFAHELGHIYDRSHVSVAGDPNNDPNYPNYGGSKTSIGEVGIDTGESPPKIYDPRGSDDIMSYGNNQWISPYTYRGILDARGKHQSAPADPHRVRPVLFVKLRLHRTERGLTGVELKQTFRIEAPGSVSHDLAGATSPLSIDLLDSDRRIVATHHCFYVRPQPSRGCSCGGQSVVPLEREPYIDLFEVIEWPGEHVAALSFHRGEAPLATVEVGEPPRIEIEGPEHRQEKLVVRVRAAHPRETPAVAVLFSGDDGVTWQPVGFDPPGGELSVEAARLPGGERCRFRAIAGAELQSAVADTEPFELAPSTRRLHVITPSDECGIPPGPVALSALIDTRGRGAVAPHEIRWTSSLQGEIGAGYDLTAELVEGEHALTVTVPDGIGGILTERAIIIVGGRPVRGPR
jgi:hypothetical protein